MSRLPEGYASWLEELKARVRTTQFRAMRAANAEVILLYWSIGRDILQRQERLGWGAKVVTQVAADLRAEFPEQRGWSPTNVKYMRMLAAAWPDLGAIGPQPVDQLPWGHIRTLLDKLDTRDGREWYAQRAVADGWSRAVLAYQIDTKLRDRLGTAPSNFADRLESSDSELAQAMVKDPYVFEHVALTTPLAERTVEEALTNRIQDTLLELGRGMAFVGRQVRFTVDGVDRYVDLVLFHTEQLRYVVVELKVQPFEPGFVGQLGTYVAIVDDVLRCPAIHAPTVGLLLCTGKREATVRYALASSAAPLAIAQWQGLPEDARAALPCVEELQAVVDDEMARQMALRRSGGGR
ncbi:MAG: PDDEXK nuclease domain-containing protein [Micrococcales bacterium]|nr:PDDEXK nuclease domain-containing protein [Micrococcales bacterium]